MQRGCPQIVTVNVAADGNAGFRHLSALQLINGNAMLQAFLHDLVAFAAMLWRFLHRVGAVFMADRFETFCKDQK